MDNSDKENQDTTDTPAKKQTPKKPETSTQKPQGYNHNTGEFVPFA